jgi:hypothetical protein
MSIVSGSAGGETDHERMRPEPPKTYYEGVVRLPGYGDAPNRCRDLKPVGFCEHGHTVLGRSSCGTRYCPDHWRDWCEEAVINMVARLGAYREAQDMGPERRLSHVVASPPQDVRYSTERLWDTRTDAYDALEAAGVPGAAVVTHPYRTNERGDTLFETAVTNGGVDEDMGKWEFLRDASEDFDDLTRYIEAEPHYHALAPGVDIDGSRAPDGWVVERVRSFDVWHYRDTEAYRDMVATAYYVLTHGGVQDGRSTTTYFGEVHPNSFKPEEELTAAKWHAIQEEAERAVKETREEYESGEGGTAGPEECPREECAAIVYDVAHLPDYLDDEEWVSSVRCTQNGRKRLARLRGVFIYWDGRSDRPPPSKLRSKERFREWLVQLGGGMKSGEGRRVDTGQQVTLGTVMD